MSAPRRRAPRPSGHQAEAGERHAVHPLRPLHVDFGDLELGAPHAAAARCTFIGTGTGRSSAAAPGTPRTGYTAFELPSKM